MKTFIIADDLKYKAWSIVIAPQLNPSKMLYSTAKERDDVTNIALLKFWRELRNPEKEQLEILTSWRPFKKTETPFGVENIELYILKVLFDNSPQDSK